MQSESVANEAPIPHAYKQSPPYDRYFEYADISESKGLVAITVEDINLVPSGYHGLTKTVEFDLMHEQRLVASGVKPNKKTALPTSTASTSRAPAAGYSYDSLRWCSMDSWIIC
jgi:hypothetical protein